MKSWGSNVVRIGLNQGLWLDGNAECAAACYQTRVGEVVGWARDAGLDTILDLHWATANRAVEPQFMAMPDADSVKFWQEVAARYANDGHVFFELYNEPHDIDWLTWKNGGTVTDVYDPDTSDTDYARSMPITYQAVGIQALYDAVRGAGAHNVVIAGGLNWTFDLQRNSDKLRARRLQYRVLHTPLPVLRQDFRVLGSRGFGFCAKGSRSSSLNSGRCPTGSRNANPNTFDEALDYAESNALHWTAWAWFATGTPG